MSTEPYRLSDAAQEVAPPPYPEEHRRPMSSVFDDLVGATLRLTLNVERLVRLTWAIVLLNVVLIASTAALLAWTVWSRQ